jgi:hypothetical protein
MMPHVLLNRVVRAQLTFSLGEINLFTRPEIGIGDLYAYASKSCLGGDKIHYRVDKAVSDSRRLSGWALLPLL